MITWWNLFPSFFLAILPFIITLIPDFMLKGKLLGGGPIRQEMANIFMYWLPEASQYEFRSFFWNGSILDEYLAILPVALIASIVIIWTVYIGGTAFITVSNKLAKESRKSISNAYKG